MDYKIDNIIEYLQVIKELQKDDLTMFYRGQADAAWELIPSLYRDKYYVGKEKNILADIRKHNYPEFAEQDLFINELVKMQHYLIPSPQNFFLQ
jgi:transposase